MSLGTSMTEIKALFQKFTNSTLNDEEKIYLNTTDKKVIFTASKIITLQISKIVLLIQSTIFQIKKK
ncbi:hypothetical protein [Acinetobacter baumannii]|uniref:hypothetical protein n=1 Tax=Acinetobacter baumannii TaxID=470 RepID=UPI003735C878